MGILQRQLKELCYCYQTGSERQENSLSTLLSIMGKECLHVCRNLPMTEEERQDADVILTKLDEYFVPKQKTIYEWYVFNCHSQKPGESLDQFLTELANLWLHASSVHLKMKCFVTASSLVCEITDTANVSYGKLRLLFKKSLIFVIQMKWQQVNDSKWNKLTLFISSTGTKLALAMRIHARILARSKTANIAKTPTELETGQPLAKHALNVTKKIILQKSFAPPPNTVMRNQRRNLKMSTSK